MQVSPGHATIPNFIRATSLIGLRRLMLMNNIRLGGHAQYFDIQQVSDKGRVVWVAWYYENSAEELATIEAQNLLSGTKGGE